MAKTKVITISNQDAMPSLGILTINAMAAADSIIIPVQAQYLDLNGMTQLFSPSIRLNGRLTPS